MCWVSQQEIRQCAVVTQIDSALGTGFIKTDSRRMNLWLPGREVWAEGIVREFGADVYTLLYLEWVTYKDLLCSTRSSSQCYVAAQMRGEFGGEWRYIHIYICMCIYVYIYMYIYMARWLYCAPETITTLLIGCVCVLVTQLCPTLCDPMDCSPPDSSVHGILQARTLEWVADFLLQG